MATRKTFTPAQMRELAEGRGSQFLMDDMKAALRYAADLIEAANAVIEENRRAIKSSGVTPSHEAQPHEYDAGPFFGPDEVCAPHGNKLPCEACFAHGVKGPDHG